MTTTVMTNSIAPPSPLLKARIAGGFYLLTFITGAFALLSVNGALVANLIATVCYVGVTMLFYDLFKPVSTAVSLIAALVSLAGCASGVLTTFHLNPLHVNSLVFFGIYCVLIGYLIFRSTFLPAFLGIAMAFGGLGWLTFISAPLANSLAPYNMAPGVLGEGLLTLWLLIFGVNVPRWKDQARSAEE